jgi:hypothetical protein
MFQPHYRPDPRIPGMGLGFFRDEVGRHTVIEHQGILPGFNGQIYLAPDKGVGVVGFTTGARNAVVWLAAEMARLLGDLIGAPIAGVRTNVPHHAEIWGDLCGWYKPIAQRSDTQALGLAGAGAEVRVRRGRLVLRALSPVPAIYRGFLLHPDDENDPYAFRIGLEEYDLGTGRWSSADTTRRHGSTSAASSRSPPSGSRPGRRRTAPAEGTQR